MIGFFQIGSNLFFGCDPMLLLKIYRPDQDTSMPFPWTSTKKNDVTVVEAAPHQFGRQVRMADDGSVVLQNAKRQKLCRSSVVEDFKLPWYEPLAVPCIKLGCIHFDVPKIGITAGSVLKHSLQVRDSLFGKHEPCIWKIGFTHDPFWRWTNSIYGYQRSVDRWSNMHVLYISDESSGPAMLEAALIEKYKGDWAQKI